nr:MAG TPA: hypothetical protein [Caudoviricetes sp.]DAT11553.1 MAG TPA: hypothetical protein [Caudoviricetes sp.]
MAFFAYNHFLLSYGWIWYSATYVFNWILFCIANTPIEKYEI